MTKSSKSPKCFSSTLNSYTTFWSYEWKIFSNNISTRSLLHSTKIFITFIIEQWCEYIVCRQRSSPCHSHSHGTSCSLGGVTVGGGYQWEPQTLTGFTFLTSFKHNDKTFEWTIHRCSHTYEKCLHHTPFLWFLNCRTCVIQSTNTAIPFMLKYLQL